MGKQKKCPGLNEFKDSVEWERALETFEFVPPGQTAAWSRSPQFRGHQILRFTSTKPAAVAVQGVLKRSLGITRFLVHDGPILGEACDEETFVAFVAALRERLGQASMLSFSSIQAYQPAHEIWLRKAGFQRSLYAVLSPLTLYVDCSDNARLEKGFTADWRKNIRKGEKNGLLFETVALADARAREDLLAIYSETFRIKGVAEHVDAPMLQALALDSRYQVFFASQAGKRISARLTFVSGVIAFDCVAGTNADGRKLSASHFLMASVLKHFGQSGVRWFDFSRIGPGRYDSIDHFKHGSGGRPVAYLGEWSLSSRPWLDLTLGTVRFLKRRERW
jgi:lipid II:glycine glycyltransferase (peptidoglycan interpeptide bridge formation enzyme)